jgi:hypothetical protein
MTFGLALLTKLPAILFAPSLAVVLIQVFLQTRQPFKLKNFWQNLLIWWPNLLVMAALGGGLFLLLKLEPAFGQLFSRGGDFLWKTTDLSLSRILLNFWENGRNFTLMFGKYLTWGGLGLIGVGLFTPKRRREIILLILMAVGFMLPIQILGKVIYARYLLPAALPLSLAIVLALESLSARITTARKLSFKAGLAALMAVLIAQSVTQSTRFMLYSWLEPNSLDFTESDQVQYLTEWSAGNGVKEVATAALKVSQTQSLLVLTEGYFGTLPDGLLLYLHQQKLGSLFVEGIGQPILGIPEKYIAKANYYDQVWLVVNSHRLGLQLPQNQLLGQYCRLPGKPCLQIWDLKPYLKTQAH